MVLTERDINILKILGSEVVEVEKLTDQNIDYNIKIGLLEAQNLNADYGIFRKIQLGNNFTYQLTGLIFEKENLSETQLINIHRNVWSRNNTFLYIVIANGKIEFYNALEPLTEQDNQLKLPGAILSKHLQQATDFISLIKEKSIIHKFFTSNTFQEYFNEIKQPEKKSPYYKLLENLQRIRKKILENSEYQISEKTLNKLLVLLILLKYIEEKEEKTENGDTRTIVDIDNSLWHNYGVRTFTELLRNGNFIEFLYKLEEKFNGTLFSLTPEEQNEIQNLNSDIKKRIAEIFEGRIEPDGQYSLWRIYSFNHLPIELISAIYETFLADKGKGIVYTPTKLVEFIIDKVMPLSMHKDFNGEFKILDPACGSGVFLVTAYRRLVQWQILKNAEKNGKFDIPDVEILKQLLKTNIYGIDKELGAAQITKYSLSLALLRFLKPITIWRQLKFDDLSENIKAKDFFDYALETNDKFDLIVGNPPFEGYQRNKKSKYFAYLTKLRSTFEVPNLPQYEIALLFLAIAPNLLKPEKNLSFILPAKFLHNTTKNAKDFRKFIFTKYSVLSIDDFTFLREVLFKKLNLKPRKIATIVLTLLNKQPTESQKIKYSIYRRHPVHESKIYFETDYYDINLIPLKFALNYSFVWKTSLLGGWRTFYLTKSLDKIEKLGDYIKKQKSWIYGEGYTLATDRALRERSHMVSEANFITGNKTVYPQDLVNDEIIRFRIEKNKYFEGSRRSRIQIFKAPHLLIREIPDLPVVFLDEDLVFKNGIVGIHAPEEDKEKLIRIKNFIKQNRKLLKFFIFATSPRAGVNYSFKAIQKTDIDNLPYSENSKDLDLSETEKIIVNDVINAYFFSDKTQSSNELYHKADLDDLRGYAETFCYVMNKMYAHDNYSYKPVKIQDLANSYVVEIRNTEKNYELEFITNEEEDRYIQQLLTGGENSAIYKTQNFIRHILVTDNEDIITFIKPKTKKMWLKSIALRDADELISDLIKAGY